MARINITQSAFNYGELSPEFQGATESEFYNKGLSQLVNFYVKDIATVYSKEGTRFLSYFSSTQNVKKVKFVKIRESAQRDLILLFDVVGDYCLFSAGDEVTSLFIKKGNSKRLTQLLSEGSETNIISTIQNGDKIYLFSSAGIVKLVIDTERRNILSISSQKFTFSPLGRSSVKKVQLTNLDVNNSIVYLEIPLEARLDPDNCFKKEDEGDTWLLYFENEYILVGGNAVRLTIYSYVHLDKLENMFTMKCKMDYSKDTNLTNANDLNKILNKTTEIIYSPVFKDKSFPTKATVYDGRLWLVDEKNNTVYGSRIGSEDGIASRDLFDFKIDGSNGGVGAVYGEIPDVKHIAWIKGGEKLFIGTDNGLYCNGTSSITDRVSETGRRITSKTISFSKIADIRCGDCEPISVGDSIFFIGMDKRSVYELTLDEVSGTYKAYLISKTASHLLQAGVKAYNYSTHPSNFLSCVLNNGQMAIMGHSKGNGIYGWSRFILGGREAKVEDIAIGNVRGVDKIYLLVSRNHNGHKKYSIEYMDNIYANDVDRKIRDAFCVDQGITRKDERKVSQYRSRIDSSFSKRKEYISQQEVKQLPFFSPDCNLAFCLLDKNNQEETIIDYYVPFKYISEENNTLGGKDIIYKGLHSDSKILSKLKNVQQKKIKVYIPFNEHLSVSLQEISQANAKIEYKLGGEEEIGDAENFRIEVIIQGIQRRHYKFFEEENVFEEVVIQTPSEFQGVEEAKKFCDLPLKVLAKSVEQREDGSYVMRLLIDYVLQDRILSLTLGAIPCRLYLPLYDLELISLGRDTSIKYVSSEKENYGHLKIEERIRNQKIRDVKDIIDVSDVAYLVVRGSNNNIEEYSKSSGWDKRTLLINNPDTNLVVGGYISPNMENNDEGKTDILLYDKNSKKLWVVVFDKEGKEKSRKELSLLQAIPPTSKIYTMRRIYTISSETDNEDYDYGAWYYIVYTKRTGEQCISLISILHKADQIIDDYYIFNSENDEEDPSIVMSRSIKEGTKIRFAVMRNVGKLYIAISILDKVYLWNVSITGINDDEIEFEIKAKREISSGLIIRSVTLQLTEDKQFLQVFLGGSNGQIKLIVCDPTSNDLITKSEKKLQFFSAEKNRRCVFQVDQIFFIDKQMMLLLGPNGEVIEVDAKKQLLQENAEVTTLDVKKEQLLSCYSSTEMLDVGGFDNNNEQGDSCCFMLLDKRTVNQVIFSPTLKYYYSPSWEAIKEIYIDGISGSHGINERKHKVYSHTFDSGTGEGVLVLDDKGVRGARNELILDKGKIILRHNLFKIPLLYMYAGEKVSITADGGDYGHKLIVNEITGEGEYLSSGALKEKSYYEAHIGYSYIKELCTLDLSGGAVNGSSVGKHAQQITLLLRLYNSGGGMYSASALPYEYYDNKNLWSEIDYTRGKLSDSIDYSSDSRITKGSVLLDLILTNDIETTKERILHIYSKDNLPLNILSITRESYVSEDL